LYNLLKYIFKHLPSMLISVILSCIFIFAFKNNWSDYLLLEVVVFFICFICIYLYIIFYLYKKEVTSKYERALYFFFPYSLLVFIIYYLFFDDLFANYLLAPTSLFETVAVGFSLAVFTFVLIYFISDFKILYKVIHKPIFKLNIVFIFIVKYSFVPLLIYLFIVPEIYKTNVRVTGTSMMNTLHDGDRPLLYKFGINNHIPLIDKNLTFGLGFIHRGDIVDIRVNDARHFIKDIEGFFIKRVIGLPGERVKIVNNKVYINDKVLDEPYVFFDKEMKNFEAHNIHNKRRSKLSCSLSECKEFTLKEDEYFLMGDNRWHSNDSRAFGPVPAYLIDAKLLYIIFSYDKDNVNLERSFKAFW